MPDNLFPIAAKMIRDRTEEYLTSSFQGDLLTVEKFKIWLSNLSKYFNWCSFCGKGKCACKVVVIATWGLGLIPGSVSGAKTQKCLTVNAFEVLKQLTVALKKLYNGWRSYTSS